jgi:hypothetical protein
MNSKIKKSISIINQIQKIRSANNRNWMNLLRLALKIDFNSTIKIISNIYEDDTKICKLVEKIKKLK